MSSVPRLRVVTDPPPDGGRPEATPAPGDMLLLATLFVLNLMPIAGEVSGVGHWSPATVGFAAGAALVTGRELWWELRVRARASR